MAGITSCSSRASQSSPTRVLRVAGLCDRAVDVRKRPGHDLDVLVLVGRRPAVRIERPVAANSVMCSSQNAGVGKKALKLVPVRCLLADLLDELALGEIERVLTVAVALARRDLEHACSPRGLTRLADKPDVCVVVGDDRVTAPGCQTLSKVCSLPSA